MSRFEFRSNPRCRGALAGAAGNRAWPLFSGLAALACALLLAGPASAQNWTEKPPDDDTLIASEAIALLHSLDAVTPGNEVVWGLRKFVVFGGVEWDTPTVEKVDAGNARATFVIWCKGWSGADVVSRRKTLVVTLAKQKDKWAVNGYKFTADEPLGIGRQIGSWLLETSGVLALLILAGLIYAVLGGIWERSGWIGSILVFVVTCAWIIGWPLFKWLIESKTGRVLLVLLVAAYVGAVGCCVSPPGLW